MSCQAIGFGTAIIFLKRNCSILLYMVRLMAFHGIKLFQGGVRHQSSIGSWKFEIFSLALLPNLIKIFMYLHKFLFSI